MIAVKYLLFGVLPLISAFTWLGILMAMLIVWEVEGHPHYASMAANQKIAYISDIGAQGLKPLFIAGCCVTTIFLDLSFIAERYLRHSGRLARNTGVAEKVLSALSIVFAGAGTAGLILLSIFDTLRHPKLHDGFLLLFIAGYVISAIFICAEYQRLGIQYRQHRVLRASFWIKLAFIFFDLILAVIFIAMTFTKHKNVGAIFEWIIALVFSFYVLSFSIDLFPAVKDKQYKGNYEQGELGNQKHALGGHELTPTEGYTDGYSNDGGYTNGNGVAHGGYHANGGTGYTEQAVNGVRYGEGAAKPVAAQNF